jgi:diacylglycerol kinase family enzyme
MLFVSNNHYALTQGELGTRSRLTGGVLSVCVAMASSQLALLGDAVLTCIAGPETAGAVEYLQARRLRVRAEGPALHVGVDGEALELPPTLEFRTLPGALRVRVPGACAA